MMRVTGIVANLAVADIAAARDFYTDYLGLSVEGSNLGWVANYRSPNGQATVQLVTREIPREVAASANHPKLVAEALARVLEASEALVKRRKLGWNMTETRSAVEALTRI
jgi:catechol 2,3-dioxygenase-like lactoylglutathione lyase family enzyme